MAFSAMRVALRSRGLVGHVRSRPFCSKEPLVSGSTVLNDQLPPPSGPANPSSEDVEKKSRGFLKLGIFGMLTGAAATAGFVSYAYTLEEVEQKTIPLRESANYTAPDDASILDKILARLYSTAMTGEGFTEPASEKLLPDLLPQEQHVFTLVLDLNETLIYSDWKRDRGWRTFKRPGVDAFLEHLAQFYEIVVYSDQLSMYVDPVIERLDQKGCIRFRLSRAATKYQDGKHYRDLSKLNRDPSRIIYVSGNALESSLQPENCVQVKPWKLEADDTTLLDLIPFLEYVARHRPADIRPVLTSYQGLDIATEFIQRSKEHQRRMQEQKQQGKFWRR
ncbi:mitochondrial import inner membrane translocase subunit TIM50-like isoform X2 [Aristolochia californica]|uniref:mitochondrial import inner membrane translocase subunit TIM50-like isoform X2 n=1 Tax=Aristolochia californica TaxID=171875 RepID=UPI0035E37CD3